MKLTDAQQEPPMLRICPMRDAVCPHGVSCPYVGDGPYGFPCKDGYRDARRSLQGQSK